MNDGYKVITNVENIEIGEQLINDLRKMVSESELERFSFFKANFFDEDIWHENLQYVDGIIYVSYAIGYEITDTEKQKECVIESTKNIFKYAHNASIRRIIMTSSFATVYPPKTKEKMYIDETFWHDENDEELFPYQYVKIISEKMAWELSKKYAIKLSTIIPTIAIGDLINVRYEKRWEHLIGIMSGKRFDFFNYTYTLIDITDLANIHLLAFKNQNAIGERFIGVSENIRTAELVKIISAKNPNYMKIPKITKVMLKIIYVILYIFNKDKRNQFKLQKTECIYSSLKVEKMLGFKKRDIKESISDLIDSLYRLGIFDDANK